MLVRWYGYFVDCFPKNLLSLSGNKVDVHARTPARKKIVEDKDDAPDNKLMKVSLAHTSIVASAVHTYIKIYMYIHV